MIAEMIAGRAAENAERVAEKVTTKAGSRGRRVVTLRPSL